MNKIKGFKNGQQNEILEDLRKIGFQEAEEMAKVIFIQSNMDLNEDISKALNEIKGDRPEFFDKYIYRYKVYRLGSVDHEEEKVVTNIFALYVAFFEVNKDGYFLN